MTSVICFKIKVGRNEHKVGGWVSLARAEEYMEVRYPTVSTPMLFVIFHNKWVLQNYLE